VVVVDKSQGSFRELKSIGVGRTDTEIDVLCLKAKEWIKSYTGQLDMDFVEPELKYQEKLETTRVLTNINSVLVNGTQLLLNSIYDSIGFNAIEDDILRHLVTARVSQPQSKMATVAYLKSYFDEDVDLQQIYRYMDKLYNTQMDQVQQISVNHTMKILDGKIGIVFYDVTTLYFESAKQDVLRTPGFSKDGKTAESQIVLGLLVSQGGYPLSYSIFNGSQYEGRTMIPIIDDFIRRFSIKEFVVVADSGLMSDTNVKLLREAGYKYILGARIRSEKKVIKDWILSKQKANGESIEYKRENGERLIVDYSEKRAAKDASNRMRGLTRLEKSYQSGVLRKDQVNKRGYNKFLRIDKDVHVMLDQKKIAEDALWDGLKGYITNTSLEAGKVIDQYHGLWVVERAFRISKGQLETRPIFHFTERRIEAHICICFIAYKIYKELERIIHDSNIYLSVDKVLSIAKTITTIQINLPINGEVIRKTLFLTQEQQRISQLFD